MAKVKLHIYPPLSYKMSSKRVGALILEAQIEQGGTLGDLIARLDNENHEAWQDIFDAHTKKMHPAIRTLLNSKPLSPSVASHTPLSDGDQIAFLILYGGG